MSLGDIKPDSLCEIESLIWKYLYLVAQCQLSAEKMMEHVLDNIVDPELLASFWLDKSKLQNKFKKKYEPIHDHTGFFFPGESKSSQIELFPHAVL